MILAAHQPGYLPWLGYFHKMARCDVFVLSDQLQFANNFFQHRNRVKINKGPVWLTVPLVSGAIDDPINEKRIANGGGDGPGRWQRQTWNTIVMNYGRAPYFGDYAEELQEVYQRRWERLIDLDAHLLTVMMSWLGIHVPVIRGSSLGLSGK